LLTGVMFVTVHMKFCNVGVKFYRNGYMSNHSQAGRHGAIYLLQSPYCLILDPYRTNTFIRLCNLCHFHSEKFLKGAYY
jgi:hypothetical protein